MSAIESCIIPAPESQPVGDITKSIPDVCAKVDNAPELNLNDSLNEEPSTSAKKVEPEILRADDDRESKRDEIEEVCVSKKAYTCGTTESNEENPTMNFQPEVIKLESIQGPEHLQTEIEPTKEIVNSQTESKLEFEKKIEPSITIEVKDEFGHKSAKEEKSVESQHNTSKSTPEKQQSASETLPLEPATQEESAAESRENKIIMENPEESARAVQLRTRKRRMSGDKPRQSSESENDNIESPLSQDQSSDEEVGGKRIKMRGKTIQKTIRKSIEQKRNVKDTDWSSDENEKPNAKRTTNELTKIPDMQPATTDSKSTKEELLISEPMKGTAVEIKIPLEEELAEHSEKEQCKNKGNFFFNNSKLNVSFLFFCSSCFTTSSRSTSKERKESSTTYACID